jgi:hypothetical protein
MMWSLGTGAVVLATEEPSKTEASPRAWAAGTGRLGVFVLSGLTVNDCGRWLAGDFPKGKLARERAGLGSIVGALRLKSQKGCGKFARKANNVLNFLTIPLRRCFARL